MPAFALKLLQDEGSVTTLDTQAHRQRKLMFMALMAPARLEALARLAADGLRGRARQWRHGSRVRLQDAFRAILCDAASVWIGIPYSAQAVRRLTRECGAMIDNAGTVGPRNWHARLLRRRTERCLRGLIEDVRAGRLASPPDSPLRAIATHRGTRGSLLTPEVGAVELLNLLRPTIAIARFMTFAALAVHQHPETRARLSTDDAYLAAFVQEVRRFYPFFPAVAGIARAPFAWREFRFRAGERFILDLYGTNHDPRSWPAPATFHPQRFIGWDGDAFTLIPQGGGDHYENHRCAGEWLTVAVMQAMLRTLVRDVRYEVPSQDLRVKLSRMPALPASGFVVIAHA